MDSCRSSYTDCSLRELRVAVSVQLWVGVSAKLGSGDLTSRRAYDLRPALEACDEATG